MQHISTTPFGQRSVSAGLLASQALAEAPAPVSEIDKWAIMDDLTAAKAVFNVTDRDLAVLSALMTFHKGRALKDGENLIVFPSNASLSARVHGMAESTLRRHIAALVKTGLIARHDSPNGKRYAARDQSGAIIRAFGMDLRPLLVRAVEISSAALKMREAVALLRRKREEVVLMLRDSRKLIVYGLEIQPGEDWEGLLDRCADVSRDLRRRLALEELEILSAQLMRLLGTIRTALDSGMLRNNPEYVHSVEVGNHGKAEEVSGNDGENERHQQNSNTEHLDLEPCLEESREKNREPNLPLALVLKACGDIHDYAPSEIRTWNDLIGAAAHVRGMMGISPHAWEEALREMGPGCAAITIAAILERFDQITSPGGYLRALSRKAAEGSFSPGPMVMALLNGDRQAA